MSEVNVKYRSVLVSLTGTTEEKIDARDVEDVLKEISKRHSRQAEKTARAMLIALNGQNILLQKRYKTVLSAGDTVSFFPLCAGG
jgi:molybdopterin synthase sulfur carrier subunit